MSPYGRYILERVTIKDNGRIPVRYNLHMLPAHREYFLELLRMSELDYYPASRGVVYGTRIAY